MVCHAAAHHATADDDDSSLRGKWTRVREINYRTYGCQTVECHVKCPENKCKTFLGQSCSFGVGGKIATNLKSRTVESMSVIVFSGKPQPRPDSARRSGRGAIHETSAQNTANSTKGTHYSADWNHAEWRTRC